MPWTTGDTQWLLSTDTLWRHVNKADELQCRNGMEGCLNGDLYVERPRSLYEALFFISYYSFSPTSTLLWPCHIMLTVLNTAHYLPCKHTNILIAHSLAFAMLSLLYCCCFLLSLSLIHCIYLCTCLSHIYPSLLILPLSFLGHVLQLRRAAGTSCTVQFSYRPCH